MSSLFKLRLAVINIKASESWVAIRKIRKLLRSSLTKREVELTSLKTSFTSKDATGGIGQFKMTSKS